MLLLFCVKESMRCAADSKGLLQMCDGVFVDKKLPRKILETSVDFRDQPSEFTMRWDNSCLRAFKDAV